MRLALSDDILDDIQPPSFSRTMQRREPIAILQITPRHLHAFQLGAGEELGSRGEQGDQGGEGGGEAGGVDGLGEGDERGRREVVDPERRSRHRERARLWPCG